MSPKADKNKIQQLLTLFNTVSSAELLCDDGRGEGGGNSSLLEFTESYKEINV